MKKLSSTVKLTRAELLSVLSGSFPPILHKKSRQYTKYCRDFVLWQGEKRRNNGDNFTHFQRRHRAKDFFTGRLILI